MCLESAGRVSPKLGTYTYMSDVPDLHTRLMDLQSLFVAF